MLGSAPNPRICQQKECVKWATDIKEAISQQHQSREDFLTPFPLLHFNAPQLEESEQQLTSRREGQQ